MSLYRALKYDSSFWFIIYFVTFAIQTFLIFAIMIIHSLMSLFRNAGSTSWLLFGGAVLIIGVLFTAFVALACMAMMRLVVKFFRSSGHSVERAGAEAGNAASKNETIRNAAIASLV
jgi:membrane protein implicated in regulation of membrane protease activity